jgi:uncharacterized cofD-like protein
MSKIMKKVVCLGGGNAMPNVVLAGLKNCDLEIVSVSSMNDSGGSAGQERESYGTPVAYGDIRRAAYQLSGAPADIKEFLNKRLENKEDVLDMCLRFPETKKIVGDNPESFIGHVVSNIILTTVDVSLGTIKAIETLKDVFQIPDGYKSLPVTKSDLTLVAEVADGKRIEGETNIDKGNCGYSKISKVYWDKNSEIYPETKKALESADVITIGPGDLYSSIAQILLVKGVSEAVKKSNAIKIYICNLMQKMGETVNFKVSNFVKEIEKYLGAELNFVIYNNKLPLKERLENYKKEHPELIDMVDFSEDLDENKFKGADVLTSSGPIVHDSKKLVKVILDLCK